MTYKCQCVSADTVFLLSTTIIFNRVVNLKILRIENESWYGLNVCCQFSFS